ncbi:MAG: hypothetical protein FVQ79_00235 [Planctomycetes bacterium]|nr:hypothetical protein [Planctomycetota bacterium]
MKVEEGQTVLDDSADELHSVIDEIAGSVSEEPEVDPKAEEAPEKVPAEAEEPSELPVKEPTKEPPAAPAKEEPSEPPAEEEPAEELEVPGKEPEKEPAKEEEPAKEPVVEVPAEEPPPPMTAEEYGTKLTEMRTATLPELQKTYGMTEEQLEDFQTDPGEVLSKLAADLHFNVFTSLYSTIVSQLPGLVNQVQSAAQQTNKLEDAFYAKWGTLKDSKYKSVVDRTVKAYRHLNPKADVQTFINESGLLAMQAAGLPLVIDAPAGAPSADTVPAKEAPVKPAAPGASGVPRKETKKKGEGSVFEEIAEEVSEGDFYG